MKFHHLIVWGPRARWSGSRWPTSPPLMVSLTKNPHPNQKKIFRVQTTRLAESFKLLIGSVALTRLEKFPRKATCDPAVFAQTAWSNPGAKVLTYFRCSLLKLHKISVISKTFKYNVYWKKNNPPVKPQTVLLDGCHRHLSLLNRVTKNCQTLLKNMSQINENLLKIVKFCPAKKHVTNQRKPAKK